MKTILILLITFPFFALSQKAEKKEVHKVIDLLFDGMKKGDSSQVRKTLLPNATLNTSFVNKKGEAKLHQDSITPFLNAIGTPHTEIWDERLLSCKIQIDDRKNDYRPD